MTFREWLDKNYDIQSPYFDAFYDKDMERCWNAALEEAAKLLEHQPRFQNEEATDYVLEVKAILGLKEE